MNLHEYQAKELLAEHGIAVPTGHPAMSLPCGLADGLPVGLMLVGKHFDEMTIYRAAHVFERSGDWQKMGPARRQGSKPAKAKGGKKR